MREPGIDPDVHDVGNLLVVARVGAEHFTRVELEPRIDATLRDAISDALEQLGRAGVPLAGLAMREQRQRHAPGALTRDAPVGSTRDHARDPLLTPGRRPAYLADLRERRLAQPRPLHADEPL